MQALLHEKEDKSILLLGICSLHPVRIAFKSGISEVDFSFKTLFNDVSFFFKLSGIQREDYVGVGVVPGKASEFAKKFGAMW